jgi:transposase-like protein
MKNPFRYFKTSPEIIRLAVMMYVKFPLSLRQVEDLLYERGVDISHEMVRACRRCCPGCRQTRRPSMNDGWRHPFCSFHFLTRYCSGAVK